MPEEIVFKDFIFIDFKNICNYCEFYWMQIVLILNLVEVY